MSVIPYLSQGIGVPVDPLTGMPKKKKQPGFTQGQVGQSLALNPQATFGPSAGVNYAAGVPGGGQQRPAGPDYRALIEQALGPLSAQLGAEGVSDMTGRDNQFIRTLGQLGEQFDLGQANQAFGEGFVGESGLGGLLPQANALAAETTGAGMSFKARADKAHKDTVRQIRNSLASRGLLRSGELGHQLQEAQGQFDTGQYDARLQVQDFLGALQKGYTDTVRQRQSQLAAAQREEAGRQAELNPMTGVSAGGYGPAAMTPGLPPAPAPAFAAQAPRPEGWIGSAGGPDLSFLDPLAPPKRPTGSGVNYYTRPV